MSKEFQFYIVPTPIGNLKDITLRAIEVLKSVDIIACEDSRITQKLLNHYEIKTKLISYHKFNERERVNLFLNFLNEGKTIALVSDAGTPLICDPGAILIEELKNNNIKRSQEIVSKAMGYARKTLSDSRLAIDDLRFQEDSDLDFLNSIENEIAQFKVISNCSVMLDLRVESEITVKIFEHILYIARECLNNIAKHSKAKNAVVEIIENDYEININISDDGIGFDVKLLDQLYGHYGLLGITERVKAIDGEIKIKSKRKSGTNINIRIPIGKGVFNENE